MSCIMFRCKSNMHWKVCFDSVFYFPVNDILNFSTFFGVVKDNNQNTNPKLGYFNAVIYNVNGNRIVRNSID